MKQFRDTPYYITEEGKVFRYYPERKHIYNKGYITKPEKYKELKPGTQSMGYKQVVLHEGFSKPTSCRVHRLVAELYVPGYFEGAHVDHIDCNKSNNHPNNLQWCTKEYNNKKGNNPNYPLFAQI